MKIQEQIEVIRANIDIIKTKLMFFVGLVGGDVLLLTNYDKINQFFGKYLILVVFNVLGIYAVIGVVFNLTELNQKKMDLEELS